MSRDHKQYDIVEKYGYPRKEISCPSCGKVYGAYGRKVCTECAECSKCCECVSPNLIDAEAFIYQYILG